MPDRVHDTSDPASSIAETAASPQGNGAQASPSDLSTWNVLVGRVSGRWDRSNLKLQPYSKSPGRFDVGATLCAQVEAGRRLLHLRTSRKSGPSYIVDCGLATEAEAEALRGAELFIHPSMRPPLPEGEFYVDEMFGWRVVTEGGVDLGEIQEILETPAHDVYVTDRAMIPAHAEFIARTDFQLRQLLVRDVPGLLID